MSQPGACTSARWARHALLAGVMLGLALMCMALATGSNSPTGTSSDTGSMSSMVMASAVAEAGRIAVLPPEEPMAGMCDACASGAVRATCALAAVAAPLTLLGLLSTRRRETFLGLLTRTTGPLIVKRERSRWCGWSVLSPISLCVWRV